MIEFYTSKRDDEVIIELSGFGDESELHSLHRQWIERHQPQRKTVRRGRSLTALEAQYGPPREFDERLDWQDEIDRSMRDVTIYEMVRTPEAMSESYRIGTVLTGLRLPRVERARQWLLERGYVDVPEPWRDYEPPTYEELERLGVD